jgi:hypothetical protein
MQILGKRLAREEDLCFWAEQRDMVLSTTLSMILENQER